MKQKIIYARTKLKHFSVISTIILAACSSTTPTPSLLMNTVSMYAEPDANQNSALAVDLVIVYSSELMGTLSQMSAKTYFSSSRQLLLDNPTLLDIWHWELVPGQIVQNFQPPQDKGDAFGAFVFANYQTPGDHRLRVTPDGIVSILFLKEDLKNLSSLSAYDSQTGMTMSTPLCCANSSDGNLKQGLTDSNSFCSPQSSQGCTKLGPTTTITRPCRAVALPPSPIPVFEVVTSSGRRGPLPIVAQPLPPFKKNPFSKYAPCNSKRNKVN